MAAAMDSHSLSKEQLLEKLERSEAGRKKLRQAISILQEKVDASEKVLEVNERLSQECEQEMQRTESEKKKAEEERRLRIILEKDSATFKDQLAKVLQRLGVVENKQKADEKEMERLRNEVKLSVEGMRASAKAADMIQSSFQALESTLLEKVKLAYEEAHTASQAVQSVQSSLSCLETKFSNLEKSVAKKGPLPEDRALAPLAIPVSERLVTEITHLFEKEKQSHSKIQDRLAMLKSIMKSGTTGSYIDASDAEKAGYVEESVQLKGARKRKSRDDEQLLNRKTKRRGRLYHVDMVSSPFCQVTSEEPSSLPGRPLSINTASNDCVDHRGSSTSKAHALMPSAIDDEALLQRENEERENDGVFLHQENEKRALVLEKKVERVLDASHGASKKTVAHKEGMIQHRDEQEGIQARAAGMPTHQADEAKVDLGNEEESDSDLDFEWIDAKEDEWFENLILLTPSLPEIASPMSRVSSLSREPHPVDGRVVEFQYNPFSELQSDIGISQHVSAKGNDHPFQVQAYVAASCEVLPGLDPPASQLVHAIGFSQDKLQNGKHFDDDNGIDVIDRPQNSTHLDDDYGISVGDKAISTEISSFLEDLPPIPSELASIFGVPSLSQDPHGVEMLKTSDRDISQDRVAQDVAMVEEGIKEMAMSSTAVTPDGGEVDGSNLLSVPGSPPVSPSSCTVFLLQAFDLDNPETKVNVAATCIVAACCRECLHLANAEKLHEALLSGSADVPSGYLACGLISAAVDLMRSKSGAEDMNVEAEPVHSLVRSLVTFIRNTFKEQANSIFDAMFTQLSRFLSKGEGILITFQGLVSPRIELDVYSVAQVIQTEDKFACQYTEATLEDVRAGGKMISWDVLFVLSS